LYNPDGTNYNGNAYAEKSWVRSLFSGGFLLYNIGSPHPSNSAWYIASYTTNTVQEVRSYTNIAVGDYLGYGIMSTSKFTQLSSPMSVNAYLALEDAVGGKSYTICPEFYYTYGTGDIATLQGDYATGGSVVNTTATNLYSWTISFPNITATNSVGFFVCRRFKVLAKNGTSPIIRVHGSGVTPSRIGFASTTYDPSLGTRGATNTLISGVYGTYDAVNRVATLPSNVMTNGGNLNMGGNSVTSVATIGMSASGGVTNGSFSFVMLNSGTNYMQFITQTNANGACQTNVLPISTR